MDKGKGLLHSVLSIQNRLDVFVVDFEKSLFFLYRLFLQIKVDGGGFFEGGFF